MQLPVHNLNKVEIDAKEDEQHGDVDDQ